MAMSKEDKEKIGSLTQQEVTEKIKKGEIVLPPASDRGEFFTFVAKTPEERAKEISGETGQPGTPAAPAASETEVSKGGEGSTAQPPASSSGEDPWWKKELGYDSEEKLKETHKSLLETPQRLQSQIDQLNASGGKKGQELKQHKEQIAKLESELAGLRKKPEIKKPELPKVPRPSDYEDGLLDERYVSDLEKYNDAMASYTEELLRYSSHVTEQKLETVEEKIRNIPKSDPSGLTEMDKLFNNDIPDFQKRFGLETTVSVRYINDLVAKSQSKDPAEVARANKLISELPPSDVANYNKIQQAMAVAYDGLNEGAPRLRYRSIESALFDNDMLGDGKTFNKVKQTQLSPEQEKEMIEKKRKENEQHVSAIPASSASSSDTLPASGQTIDEKKKRLKDLLDVYNIALNRGSIAKNTFEKSPEFEEMQRLRKEIQPLLRP
jgi:hypothetical protein